MKHGSNPRRGRSRGNGKRHSNPKNQTFESNGPDVKVRGSAQQVLEKYLALARDASSSGDRVNAESYLQFAEHYYRVLTASQQNAQQNQQGGNGGRKQGPTRVSLDDEPMGEETEVQAEAGSGHAEAASDTTEEAPKPRRRGRNKGDQDQNQKEEAVSA